MKPRLCKLSCLILLWVGTGFALTNADSTYCRHLYYTCKVWGFLKYYSPLVAQGTIDWDNALLELLVQIKKSNTIQSFNTTMENFIGRVAPNLRTRSVSATSKKNIPGQDWNWLSDDLFSTNNVLLLQAVREYFLPFQNRYYSIALDQPPVFDCDNQYQFLSEAPSIEMRLLALFRYWNIVQYFYPYRNIMDQDWDFTLKEFIEKMVTQEGKHSYYYTLLELRTRLNDSHASLTSPYINSTILGDYYLPLVLKQIENQTLISMVLDESAPVKPGDIIKAIDGEPIQALRERLRKIAHGSNPGATDVTINRFLLRGNRKDVRLTTESIMGEMNVTLARSIPRLEYSELVDKKRAINRPIWQTLSQGGHIFGYVDLSRLERNDIFQMVADLWKSDALIMDMRGYPKGTMSLLISYLLRETRVNALFLFPDPYQPGEFYWEESTVTGNAPDIFLNPIAVLVNENTVSQAEYMVMALQLSPNAMVVGSQTAAADGNIVYIYLPGEVTAAITGIGVFYPDTTQTQRIGIAPNVVVECTIQGIRAGRDEVLEKALEVLLVRITKIEPRNHYGSEALQLGIHPNPFQTTTTITIHSSSTASIIIWIYDIRGRLVRRLQATDKRSQLTWDGCDEKGRVVSSGLYFLQVQTQGLQQTIKAMRIP